MLYESIAERYAQAIFDLSMEGNALKEWEAKLSAVVETIDAHGFLGKALASPRITAEVKKDMLKKVFAGAIPGLMLNFLFILVDKGRQNYLKEILRKFTRKVQEREGTVTAQITAAVTLTPSAEKSLTSALSKYTGKTVRLECTVDPAVVGGAVVRLEGKIMDWSLASHLENIKAMMKADFRL